MVEDSPTESGPSSEQHTGEPAVQPVKESFAIPILDTVDAAATGPAGDAAAEPLDEHTSIETEPVVAADVAATDDAADNAAEAGPATGLDDAPVAVPSADADASESASAPTAASAEVPPVTPPLAATPASTSAPSPQSAASSSRALPVGLAAGGIGVVVLLVLRRLLG